MTTTSPDTTTTPTTDVTTSSVPVVFLKDSPTTVSMDGSPALAQPPSQPQPETVVSPAAKTLPNTSISPTTLAKATLASPTLKDWFKWSPGEQNLENLAQLAFPEVFDLAWGLDLIPAEEEDGDVKEDHCHDEEGGTSPSKDFIIRSPLSTLAFLNDSSSLNVTPPYDTFASPSPERSPYYYYNGNGNDSKDDSEDGGPFAISSGSDQDDEYAEIGIDLTKYVRPQRKQAHNTLHTNRCANRCTDLVCFCFFQSLLLCLLTIISSSSSCSGQPRLMAKKLRTHRPKDHGVENNKFKAC